MSPNVLVTVIVTLKVPLTVGVPEMTPVDESIVTPFGSPVAPKVNALVAVTVYENAVSSAPLASSVAFVITGITVAGATTRGRVYISLPSSMVRPSSSRVSVTSCESEPVVSVATSTLVTGSHV